MKRPNILLYNGPGVSSLQAYLFEQLKLHLSLYDVMLVSDSQLLNEPWEESTALLIMPGGRDKPYVSSLYPKGTTKITNYVLNGGKYMGICAGAYFACSEIEFELDRPDYAVKEPRYLKFLDCLAMGSVTANFSYDDTGGSVLPITYMDVKTAMYAKGGCSFHPKDTENISIIAKYENGNVAILQKSVGLGKIILSGPHFEVGTKCIQDEIQHFAELQKDTNWSKYLLDRLAPHEEERCRVFVDLLLRLDLQVNESEPQVVSPIYFSAIKPADEQMILLKLNLLGSSPRKMNFKIQDTKNTFWVERKAGESSLNKCDFVFRLYPNTSESLFETEVFFQYLKQMSGPKTPVLGSCVAYAHTTTSTQTLMDSNNGFGSLFKHGAVFIASNQIQGRGRGKNTWISQQGCLMFSLRLVHKRPQTAIFLQYLFGLAVAEAFGCTDGYPRLQLKWPNDIYIESNGLYKVGGILVTSEYQHGIGFVVTVGCGLNVFNQKPARCISEFMNDPAKLSLELALAKILTRFESIYEEFCEYNEADCQNPFEIFQDRYHACWMHGNQRVVVDSQKGPIECIINGISSSGLLKAIPVRGGEELLLQPDGNSFDMLKGLISAKKT